MKSKSLLKTIAALALAVASLSVTPARAEVKSDFQSFLKGQPSVEKILKARLQLGSLEEKLALTRQAIKVTKSADHFLKLVAPASGAGSDEVNAFRSLALSNFEEFRRLGPSFKQIHALIQKCQSMECALKVSQDSLPLAKSAADFFSLIEFDDAEKEEKRAKAFAEFAANNAATLAKLAPNAETMTRLRKYVWETTLIRKVNDAFAKEFKKPDDFKAIVTSDFPTSSYDSIQSINQAGVDHLSEFLALKPSMSQIMAFLKALSDPPFVIQAIEKISAIKPLKKSDVLELTGFRNSYMTLNHVLKIREIRQRLLTQPKEMEGRPGCSMLLDGVPACASAGPIVAKGEKGIDAAKLQGLTEVARIACALDAALTKKVDPDKIRQCAKYSLETKPTSFAALAPAGSKLEGIEFPRASRTLYRGTDLASPQFDTDKALAAMFGSASGTVGSRLHSEIRDILLGKVKLEESSFNGELFESGILDPIDALLECGEFTEEDANLFATDLMEKFYKSLAKKTDLAAMYFDESSPTFKDWPKDAVYSSVYQYTASWYGGKTLLFKEKTPRGIDMNYWEYKNKSLPFDKHYPADAGEVLTPGYISHQDVTGFWMRDQDAKIFDEAGQASGKTSGIQWALQKTVIGGQTYVALLDTQGHTCMDQGSDGKFYYCRRNYPKPAEPGIKPYPILEQDKEVPIMGLLRVCAGGATGCEVPSSVWAGFKKTSKASVPKEVKSSMERLAVPGGSMAYFPAGQSKPAYQASTLKIEKAMIGGKDVTAYYAKACNGHPLCDVKALSELAPGLKFSDKDQMVIEATCSNTPKDKKALNFRANISNQLMCDGNTKALEALK